MDDYRQVSNEPDGQIVLNPDPYVYGHQELIGQVLNEVHKFPKHRKEFVAFLYDEHSKASLLQNSWPRYKQSNPNWAKSAGILEPLDDKLHVPIQMADLLAHTTTHTFLTRQTDPEEAKEKLKGWLKGNLMQVAYANADYLRAIVAHNLQLAKSLGAKGGLF